MCQVVTHLTFLCTFGVVSSRERRDDRLQRQRVCPGFRLGRYFENFKHFYLVNLLEVVKINFIFCFGR